MMNNEFSTKLANLRKEKKLSQKNAAVALGVSQALLSHYERGIREYGLAFLKRACEFYDVSADYILGLSDRRKKLSESGFDLLYSETDPIVDLLRQSSINVCKDAGIENAEIEPFILKLSALDAYRLSLTLAVKDEGERGLLAEAIMAESLLSIYVLHQQIGSNENSKDKLKLKHDELNLVINQCESFLEENLNSVLKKDRRKNKD